MTIIGFPHASMLEQVIGWFIFHIIGTFTAVILLAYGYSKVYQGLKKEQIFNNKINPSRVLVYIFLPIFGFVPWVLADTYVYFNRLDEYPFPLGITVATLRRFWGIFNLSVFWFLGRSKPEEETFEDSLGTSYLSNSVDPDLIYKV